MHRRMKKAGLNTYQQAIRRVDMAKDFPAVVYPGVQKDMNKAFTDKFLKEMWDHEMETPYEALTEQQKTLLKQWMLADDVFTAATTAAQVLPKIAPMVPVVAKAGRTIYEGISSIFHRKKNHKPGTLELFNKPPSPVKGIETDSSMSKPYVPTTQKRQPYQGYILNTPQGDLVDMTFVSCWICPKAQYASRFSGVDGKECCIG